MHFSALAASLFVTAISAAQVPAVAPVPVCSNIAVLSNATASPIVLPVSTASIVAPQVPTSAAGNGGSGGVPLATRPAAFPTGAATGAYAPTNGSGGLGGVPEVYVNGGMTVGSAVGSLSSAALVAGMAMLMVF